MGMQLKFTQYFLDIRSRPDRAVITDDMLTYVIENSVKEVIQSDGRIRRWASIKAMNNKYLRVILLSDGETVHNAFFDRGFTP